MFRAPSSKPAGSGAVKNAVAGDFMAGLDQRALFCNVCGKPPSIAGFCAACYHRRRRSLRFFAGLREAVLRRDRSCCQGCGAENQRAVHHRRPGLHDFQWLITLCPACHAVVHKLQAHRRWLPVSLLELWREQHPALPVQLQLDIPVATPRQEQPPI